MLNDLFIGYLAGFIDGEGCLNIRFHKDKKTPQCRYRITISIGQRIREPLDYIRQITGFGKIQSRQRVKNRKRSGRIVPVLCQANVLWITRQKEVESLLLLIEPHLVVKREQARLLIELMGRIRAKTVTEAWASKIRLKVQEAKRIGMLE